MNTVFPLIIISAINVSLASWQYSAARQLDLEEICKMQTFSINSERVCSLTNLLRAIKAVLSTINQPRLQRSETAHPPELIDILAVKFKLSNGCCFFCCVIYAIKLNVKTYKVNSHHDKCIIYLYGKSETGTICIQRMHRHIQFLYPFGINSIDY